MEYKFENIAFNSTAKKLPEDSDRQHYIGLEHLDSNSLYVSRWGSDVTPIGEKLLMKKGDILFGKRRAYQRKVGIAPFDGIFSAHGMVLRPKENIMDKDFFPFFIGSDQFMERAIRISVGGLSPTINWKDLKEQVFDIPSLDEQKSLATKLWAAYKLREEYKRLLAATDEMVKSQFIEMFGDTFKNDKNWPFKKLPEVTTIVLGSTPSSSNSAYWDGDIKWITPAEIEEDSFYLYDSARHLTEDGVQAASLKSFPTGTVILSTRAPIGKTAIAGCEMYCNQGFKNFVCKKDLNSVYLYYTLKSHKEELQKMGTGSTFLELSKKAIEQIAVSIPPRAKQDEFETIYQQADKSKFVGFKSLSQGHYKR